MDKKIIAFLLAFILLSPAFAFADDDVEPAHIAPVPVAPILDEPADVSSYQKAADQILAIFTFRYSDAKGIVDYPALFNALGSLAGFGCQMAVKESFIDTGIIQEDAAFYIYKSADGQRYYLSTLVDAQLEGNERVKTSVLSLVSGAAQRVGVKTVPNVKEINEYNFKSMGTDNFGVPRVTEKYKRMETPIAILDRNWLPMKKIFAADHVDSKFYGWTFALAAHDAILKHYKDIDVAQAQQIVMETAVPMATIDPKTLILKP